MNPQPSNPLPDVDKRRLEIEEKRLALEFEKQNFDRRFANRHLATPITAAVSVLAICMSAAQIAGTLIVQRQEAEKARKQQATEKQSEADRLDRDWRLQFLRFVVEHRKEMFASDIATQRQFTGIIVTVFPENVAAQGLKKLADFERDRAAEGHGATTGRQTQKGQPSSEEVWRSGQRAAEADLAKRTETELVLAMARVSPLVLLGHKMKHLTPRRQLAFMSYPEERYDSTAGSDASRRGDLWPPPPCGCSQTAGGRNL